MPPLSKACVFYSVAIENITTQDGLKAPVGCVTTEFTLRAFSFLTLDKYSLWSSLTFRYTAARLELETKMELRVCSHDSLLRLARACDLIYAQT